MNNEFPASMYSPFEQKICTEEKDFRFENEVRLLLHDGSGVVVSPTPYLEKSKYKYVSINPTEFISRIFPLDEKTREYLLASNAFSRLQETKIERSLSCLSSIQQSL